MHSRADTATLASPVVSRQWRPAQGSPAWPAGWRAGMGCGISCRARPRAPIMPINPTDLSQPGQAHVPSYWAATAGPEVEDVDPVSSDLDVDVAIIGGGYTGLSTAYHLGRDHGIAARVLEAHRIGWGCSGRNGGFCSTGMGKDDFGAWVSRFGLDAAKAVFEQSR